MLFDRELYKELKISLRHQISLQEELSDEEVKEVIAQVVKAKSQTIFLSISRRVALQERLFNTLRRLDLLQPLVDDPKITEIMINGIDEIFVEEAGSIRRLDYGFDSVTQLENIIQMIVGKVNRVVNESNPICDARLEDGSRINVVLPPVALKGPTLTIRKFPEKPITMTDLIQWQSISEEVAKELEVLVQAKYNIFISGGTGSGKTTFLNVLSNAIPKDERLVTIEDSAELQITQIANLVSLETRNANVEGQGRITIRDLIKSSLRMRPDRIVVGEVRGEEAMDMLQAMNTGHDGSLSTGHANSTRDMLTRLETMVLTGADIPLEAIRQQISSAIDIMIHLGRRKDKSRKVLEISEVIGYQEGSVKLNTLYSYKEISGEEGQLEATGQRIIHREKLEALEV